MRLSRRPYALLLAALLVAPAALLQAQSPVKPPVAAKNPHTTTVHGIDLVDNYYWLNDKTNPEVIAYLNAENEFTQAMMAHTADLQETIFEEMKGRIKETDLSVPYKDGPYYYYSRTEEGKNYPIFCRKKGSLDAPEEVLLDGNELAEGHDYFRPANIEVSPDHNMLAFAIDTTGGEKYTLQFRDLTTGEFLPDRVEGTYYSVAWSLDNKTIFYTRPDEAMRPWQAWRHTVGSPATDDALVYQEDDDAFFLGVETTRSDAYIFISLGSAVTNEVRYLDANDADGEFQILEPREQDVEYSVDHRGDEFFILTNAGGAENFKLMAAPVASPGKANWRPVVGHDDGRLLSGVNAFKDHLVLTGREFGLPQIWVRPFETREFKAIKFPEVTYSAYLSANPDFETDKVRFSYSSFVTPQSVYDYDIATGERELLKQDEVLGGYDPAKYEVRYEFATARDGTQVPVSILTQKGAELNGEHPALLYSYGSYGSSSSAGFNSRVFSLVDRGFVYAIAHIRGGSEMGRHWYLDGKYLNKKNTFFDFIDCAEYLIRKGYTNRDQLGIMGGSAGGLLMGAVVNERPDLFAAVVAAVPFVDVMNTMLDETIPLTVIEWEEWGNPYDKTYFDYMMSYSPYDNVKAADYPAMLVTAGLNDPRVGYWEPAKWVARIRTVKTDDSPLMRKTNMRAGHSGASGRYDRLREQAFEYAFLVDQLTAHEGALPAATHLRD
jgi:oligopeptidase B